MPAEAILVDPKPIRPGDPRVLQVLRRLLAPQPFDPQRQPLDPTASRSSDGRSSPGLLEGGGGDSPSGSPTGLGDPTSPGPASPLGGVGVSVGPVGVGVSPTGSIGVGIDAASILGVTNPNVAALVNQAVGLVPSLLGLQTSFNPITMALPAAAAVTAPMGLALAGFRGAIALANALAEAMNIPTIQNTLQGFVTAVREGGVPHADALEAALDQALQDAIAQAATPQGVQTNDPVLAAMLTNAGVPLFAMPTGGWTSATRSTTNFAGPRSASLDPVEGLSDPALSGIEGAISQGLAEAAAQGDPGVVGLGVGEPGIGAAAGPGASSGDAGSAGSAGDAGAPGGDSGGVSSGGEAPHRGGLIRGTRPRLGMLRAGADEDRDRRRNVPAMLEQGEFVVRAESAKNAKPVLSEINKRGRRLSRAEAEKARRMIRQLTRR